MIQFNFISSHLRFDIVNAFLHGLYEFTYMIGWGQIFSCECHRQMSGDAPSGVQLQHRRVWYTKRTDPVQEQREHTRK